MRHLNVPETRLPTLDCGAVAKFQCEVKNRKQKTEKTEKTENRKQKTETRESPDMNYYRRTQRHACYRHRNLAGDEHRRRGFHQYSIRPGHRAASLHLLLSK